jgi:hypothetical protein
MSKHEKLNKSERKPDERVEQSNVVAPPNLEDLPTSERMSVLLNSPATLNKIREFPEKNREKVVGEIIEYLILFPETTDLEAYLDELQTISKLEENPRGDLEFEGKKIQFIISQVKEKLGLEESDTTADEKIYQYLAQKFYKEGYYFHAFNGSFEESVRENGLDLDKRDWDWEKLERIREICTPAGEPRILGWGDLNCKGKISITDETDFVYRYGVASPEWFAQFTSEGLHMPNREPYDKKAFYKRDYNAAKNNILLLCEKLMASSEEDIKNRKAHPNITAAEKIEMLNFFEEHWKLFANEKSSPKCALIKRAALQKDTPPYATYEEYARNPFAKDPTLQKAVGFLFSSFNHDKQHTENISPKDISIVDLPEYTEVHPSS